MSDDPQPPQKVQITGIKIPFTEVMELTLKVAVASLMVYVLFYIAKMLIGF